MKTKIFIIANFYLMMCNYVISQNITNTLGTSGTFTIKDNSASYLTLNQSTGHLTLNRSLYLSNTISATTGVIYKGTNRFLHNYGSDNLFLGVNSGNFTMTGNSNSGFGYESLSDNTTGYFNSAFGYQSLTMNTTGSGNSSFGYRSLLQNFTGSQNSAFGYHALLQNSSGSLNSAFGTFSLPSNLSGDGNTAVGHSSLSSNSSGHLNTAVGYTSGTNITTGINNTTLGNNAQVPSGTSNNQVRIGNTSVTYAGVQVAWTITSDRKWKQNISHSNLGLGFISKLNPVFYNRINDESNKTEYGLIAQEVEEVLKEEGVDNSAMLTITDEGNYELRYNDLLAPMIKAIQELKAENDKMKDEINELKKNILSPRDANSAANNR